MSDAERDLNNLVATMTDKFVRIQFLTTIDVRELTEALRRVLAHPSEHFREEDTR